MNADVAARLREFGQFLDDVEDAWGFVHDALMDAPELPAAATDHLANALTSAN